MSRRRPPVTPVFASVCIYQPDPDAPPDADGDQPCTCHMPHKHPRHRLPPAPDVPDRLGEREDDR
ncbi:hypothetical protein [Phytohabitans aurantiacus]|uniref:Uncharacterized protein n=1 Tax=Phytohabitans aurantiacus TaxID=3016789 RepID=A0ABQ5QRY1_9ACTN|nr:hypothetical protein [Phytohabitans aurantiacus]GLH97375.1 hypothetical protein Pa4123_26500 [Phytohabitans aurantiacus]